MRNGADAASAVLDAARALAEARVREADAFLRHKTIPHCTDGQAERMAVVDTQDAVTTARAAYEVALWQMRQYDDLMMTVAGTD